MAYAFNASNQFITGTLGAALTRPLTYAAWIRRDVTASNLSRAIMGIQNLTTNDRLVAYTNGGAVLAGYLNTGVGSSTKYSSGQTVHAAIIQESDVSRSAYLDGGGKASNSTLYSVSGTDVVSIGARYNSSWGLYADGRISEAAIWNAVLTDDEIVSLAKGFKPARIRPQSLVFYAPLLRNLQDLKGLALTNNNGATVADHPRVY